MKIVEPIRNLKTIKKLREVLRSQSTRNELLFILGINVGIRVSDILNLKTKDLLMPNNTVKNHVVITEKKTGKTKKFYIGDIVKECIKDHYKSIGDYTPEKFVFDGRKGNKAITRIQAYRILNSSAEIIDLVERDDDNKIVVGEIGTHTLRKTFGYHAYQNGTPLALLMQIFNHSAETQTLRYIGITEESKKNVYLNSNLG